METIAKQIHTLLIKNKKTVAVAESCTGGYTCMLLTQFPGSSAYFLAGIVAYHNSSKTKLLGISKEILKKHGAVSAIVARKMAEHIRKTTGANLSIGITGIAGPSGATKNKPIGTVFIGLSGKRQIVKRFLLRGTRMDIQKKTALKALQLLKKII
ncbi:MAG: CinA family protein [Candidatus Omnitrophica bacterium]|jgi:PncC family amidohydrolase|nr:CinA family protein [Candidatus Omnitrophota bacterium]